MTGILEACSAMEEEWSKIDRRSWTPAHGAEMLRAYDDTRCENLTRRFVKNGTWLVPTSSNFSMPQTSNWSSSALRLPTEMERWTAALKSRQATRDRPMLQVALRRQRFQ